MKDKFRVGQKVRIVKTLVRPHLLGVICTIEEQRQDKKVDSFEDLRFVYKLDIKADNKQIYAEEFQLEPVYDGDEKSSWSECDWSPYKLSRQDKPLTQTEKHVTLPT